MSFLRNDHLPAAEELKPRAAHDNMFLKALKYVFSKRAFYDVISPCDRSIHGEIKFWFPV